LVQHFVERGWSSLSMNSKIVAAIRARGSQRKALMGVSLAVLLCCVGVIGQTQQQKPVSQSELARENLSRVAANTEELGLILHRDPGLMVEVKRWIAKDATDHGQIITEADLAEDAIFDRLEIDVTFRSVVTDIVQKYGYLLPIVNPDSPLAKQQDLVMQERAKWITEEEEADREKFKQTQEKALEEQNCDPRSGNCPAQNAVAPGNQPYPQQQQIPGMMNQYPQENIPGLEPPISAPPGPYAPPVVPQGGNGTDLLRTSVPENGTGPGQQGQAGSGISGSSVFGQDQENEDTQGGSYSQRGFASGMQSQGGGGIGEFGDLSLDSDFGTGSYGQGMYGSAGGYSTDGYGYSNGPYANLNGASYGQYGNNSSGSGTRSNYSDLSYNNAVLREQARREREATTPNQRLVRRANPYAEIPSLYDMYLQASAHPPAVQRFGMQVFEFGTRDLQAIPMDLPVGPDYVLGPGDGVSVNLWGGVSRRFYQVVDHEGRLNLPESGPVLVSGKSLAEVQELVQKNLRTQFRDVSADVSLSRLRSIRVYVVGDVVRPGAYDVGSLSTPLNALFAAGGPTGRGSLRILKHYRGDQLVQNVDVYDLLLHGVKGNIARLENGDTVIAPPLGGEVTVEGMVRRPAIYELKDEKTLSDALSLAGGLLPTATLRHVEVQRVVAHEKQTMLSLDIPQDDSSEEATKQLDSFKIQDGDKIRIFPIAPYNQDAVYLEGHVIRPGKYSYKQGMRVTDLVASYKDMLPEPALQYGEIIRLSLPDYRPTVESFSLAEALADPKNAPELQPLDTVQIFGRYDFENPPTVSVLGDVRRPGTYKTSGDIHLSDAIHLAGGLQPDAQTEDAQVFRYMPDSTMKILNVKLSTALDGSPTDNIMLTSRDRVLVHKSAAAADPATVLVKGDVERPGRYPLTAEMTVSDLLAAAGGLKQSADLQTADLTHYVWKDDKQVTGDQDRISLAKAMSGDASSNKVLNNGDVLSIRQVPGWEDLGASIMVRGEVVHPGTYGIRPGERLSSILMRAGGFGPAAYPYGAVLLRTEVQKLEMRSYTELVQRVREQQASLKLTSTTTTDPDQKLSAESALTQWQTTLDNLVSSPPTGRVTIEVSSDIRNWANGSRDITVRSGDILVIPKRPSYVLVQGQVYGPTAVSYRPGKSARWYLTQAGGTTNMANKRATFVVRANGTVISNHSSGWMTGDSLGVALQPGDMVVVPEKALGGPPIWKTLFANAQVLSSITTSAILAAAY
jgi:polysaccharide biosynthesis/export protein